MVMMTPVGAGIRGSIYHSHSFDAQATRTPGWKIVMPSNPRDAYGLMLERDRGPEPGHVPQAEGAPPREGAARRGDPRRAGRPQDALEDDRRSDRRARNKWKPEWPKLEELYIPIGKARTAREGRDVTVLTYGRNVPMAVAAADELREQRGDRGRGHRPALAPPVRLGRDQGEREEDASRALRERGHRGDELRRAPDPPRRSRSCSTSSTRRRSSSRARTFRGSASPTTSSRRAFLRRRASRMRSASSPATSPEPAALHVFEGGCHCGRVRFRVRTGELRALDCNCSICAMKGFLHLIVTKDAFELLSGSEDLATYTWGTHVAKHTFCRVCGAHPFYTPRSHPDGVDVERPLPRRRRRGVRFVVEPFDGKDWEANVDRITREGATSGRARRPPLIHVCASCVVASGGRSLTASAASRFCLRPVPRVEPIRARRRGPGSCRRRRPRAPCR